MQLLLFGITCLGCVLVYLTHKNQRWLTNVLPSWPWRVCGYGVLGLAFWGYCSVFKPLSATLSFLVLLMLIFGLLPFLTFLFERSAREC